MDSKKSNRLVSSLREKQYFLVEVNEKPVPFMGTQLPLDNKAEHIEVEENKSEVSPRASYTPKLFKNKEEGDKPKDGVVTRFFRVLKSWSCMS